MTFKATLQFQDLDEITVDFISFNYSVMDNSSGQFQASFHANVLQYIIPGMYFRIYWNEEPIFSGRLGQLSEETADSISFNGVDEVGMLADRLVDYVSANVSSPFSVEEKEASLMMQELLKVYTGKTSTDSRYDITSHVFPSQTVKIWRFTNTQLGDACFELANSSFVNTEQIGFSFTIDGARKVRFAPIGTGIFHKDVVYKLQNMSFDNQGVKNDIQFIGGVPDPIPQDRDQFTESVTGWSITYGTATVIAYDPTSTAPDVNNGSTAEGDYAIRIENGADQNLVNVYLNFSSLTTYGMTTGSEDWSDGEGNVGNSVVKRPQENVAKGNFILDYIQFKWRWSTDKHGQTPLTRIPGTDCPYPQVSFYLNTNGGSTSLTTGSTPTSNHMIFKELKTGDQFLPYCNNSWKNGIMYPVSDDGAGIDITDIEGLIIRMAGITYVMKANVVFLWIDALSFHFHQVNVRKQNTDSINVLKSVRTASFSNRDIRNWKTGHAIAQGLLKRLDKEIITADIEIAFNPNIRINDVVRGIWKGKEFRLIVKAITVTSEERMTLIVGKYQAQLPALLAAYKAVEIKDQTSSKGYKLNESFADSRCFTLCEIECEETCQADKNQTADGVIVAAGSTVKNPCAESCQTYIEI